VLFGRIENHFQFQPQFIEQTEGRSNGPQDSSNFAEFSPGSLLVACGILRIGSAYSALHAWWSGGKSSAFVAQFIRFKNGREPSSYKHFFVPKGTFSDSLFRGVIAAGRS
jgi:hypothetical protein